MISDYEKFNKIVSCRSITEAAKQLYISQPALSKYIKQLEKQLDTTLINRTTTPLSLTAAGKIYYRYVQKQIALHHEMTSELSKIVSGLRVEVYFGVNMWRGSVLLPALIRELDQKYPNLKLSIMEGRSQNLINELLRGGIEFALINESQFSDKGLHNMEIFKEHILGVTSLDYARRHELLDIPADSGGLRVLQAKDFSELRLILQKPGQNLAKFTNQWLNDNKIVPTNSLYLENISTSLNIVAEGYGLTFMPEQGRIQKHLPDNLVFFKLGSPPLKWGYCVYYQKHRALSHYSQLIIAELKELNKSFQ